MVHNRITHEAICCYQKHLQGEEYSAGTIEKYIRDVSTFTEWLADKEVSRENTSAWKEHLIEMKYAPVTINSMLSAVNNFLRFMGWEECKVKFLRIQRCMFRKQEKELCREEYECLLETAKRRGKERLALLMETICSTGIRVSEVKYITVEAAENGRTEIWLKGKIRTILLPGKLCRRLLKYAKKQQLCSGEIFLTASGSSLSRRQIWKEMKQLCRHAGVEASKVFPHNLRHLFASVFYRASRDIVKLADILGHSCIETTRIYLYSTGQEHIQQMECLGLLS